MTTAPAMLTTEVAACPRCGIDHAAGSALAEAACDLGMVAEAKATEAAWQAVLARDKEDNQ